MKISKVFVFSVVNSAIGFVLWVCLFLYFPIIFAQQPVFVIVSSTIILALVVLMDISYFKGVFGNPGYLEAERNILNFNEEEFDQVKKNTVAFNAKLNSARRFISLGGGSIKKEELDYELAVKFSKMSISEVKKEMEKIYIEFIDKSIECKKCNIVKPPRTHHCNVCQKCVRRMDHHCPWIGNCVGEDNLKNFLRFTGYATVALLVVSLLILFNYVIFGEVC